MKTVAILQSNYIPWKGYFDLINQVDTFIIYDEMQYTKRDWRNRNKIKTANGVSWLTIPVEVKGKFGQKINETKISDKNWNKDHWNTIKNTYAKAPFFSAFKARFEDMYLNDLDGVEHISRINLTLMRLINDLLNIETEILIDSDLGIVDGKSERLLDLCQKVNASTYLSGPAAKGYLDEGIFNAENIKVEWMDYSGYPEYNQMYPPFNHEVSIIDLIFNEGVSAPKFMKSSSN